MFGIDRANETWTVLLRRPAGAASAEPRLRQSAATAIAKRSIPKPLLLQLERGHWSVASTLPPSVILLQPRRNQCTPEPARRFRTWQCHCRLCLLCSWGHFPADLFHSVMLPDLVPHCPGECLCPFPSLLAINLVWTEAQDFCVNAEPVQIRAAPSWRGDLANPRKPPRRRE